MITINTYIFLSIIGITTLSMFLNIYVTIKLFQFFHDGQYTEQEREIEELEVDNLYLKEEIKELSIFKLEQEASRINNKIEQALGVDNLDPTIIGVEISQKKD